MASRRPRGRSRPGSAFRPEDPLSLLERTLPVAADVRSYGLGSARREVPAGLTVAALALPAALAYAELAGLPPITGLYALLLPTAMYVLLGSSKQLVIGPEGSISALVAAAVVPFAAAGKDGPELAATLALLVAACFAGAWAAKLDWIADYFSRPVLIGYLHGVAIVLVLSQLEKLLGVNVPDSRPMEELLDTFLAVPDASGATLLVALGALGALLPLRFLAPRFPTALGVVLASIALSWLVDLEGRGVAVVGDLPSGLPSIDVPTPALRDVLKLVVPAIGIFLVSYADEVLTARSFAGRHGQNIRARQELAAMGAANLGGGLTGGFPIGASGSRTAVNDQMGARTQVAGVVTGLTVVLVLLFLTGPIAYLPKAVLGAVIVSAALGLVSPDAWRGLRATDRVELAIAVVTTAGVVLIGVLNALAVAVGLSIIDVVRRSARPHDAVLGWIERLGRWGDVAVHRDAVTTPGVVVYRLDDRLFFANAGYFKGRVREAIRAAKPGAQWLVLDFEATVHVDATGAEALEELHGDLAADGIAIAIARAKSQLRARLDATGLTGLIGPEHLHPTVRSAVAACTRITAAADAPTGGGGHCDGT